MKKILYSIFTLSLLLCGLSLSSCSSDEETIVADKGRMLQITTEIEQSRAIKEGTQFEKGDTIGLVLNGSDFLGDCSRYAVYDGVNWKLSSDFDLLSTEGDVKIKAYYPYHHDGMVGLSTGERGWRYLTTHPSETDYLISNEVVVNQDYNVAKLTFNHLMSRITLSITKSPELADKVNLVSSTLANFNYSRDVTLFGVAQQVTSTDGYDPTVKKDFTKVHNCVLSSEPVIVDYLVNPQSIAGKNMILNIDNKNYTVSFPDITLIQGKRYTFNIVVKEDSRIYVEISDGVITLWGVDDSMSLEEIIK